MCLILCASHDVEMQGIPPLNHLYFYIKIEYPQQETGVIPISNKMSKHASTRLVKKHHCRRKRLRVHKLISSQIKHMTLDQDPL